MNQNSDPLHIDCSVLQLFPDHTDKVATFDTGSDQVTLPVTAFATVMRLGLPPHGLPHVQVVPVVEEPDYGLITSIDLEADTGWVLVEVL